MKYLQKIITALTVLSLTACQSELPRRYKSMTVEQRVTREPLVRVSAFAIEQPKSSDEPGVLQLSGEGQASLITAIAKVDNSLPGMYQQLSKSFEKQASINVVDRSQFTKRIIFSTQKTDLAGGPADRISKLEFRLKLRDYAGLQFQQWNRFETDYREVDLGKIGLKKGAELSAKLSPTFGGTLNAGEAGVTVSKELSEEITLRQRSITLTGTLDTHSATLMQEGAVGIDLTGNTSIDLHVKFSRDALESDQTVVKFDSFKTSKGLKTPKEISYRLLPIYIPKESVIKNLGEGVRCSLTGNYVLRHVRKGSDTYMEGDDVVLFLQGELAATPDEISLIGYEELKQLRVRFFIHSLDDVGEILAIEHSLYKNLPLDFATYEEAEDFLSWINETSKQNINISDSKLRLKQEPLRQSDVVNLRIGLRE